jgi:hypothetical protein
MSWDDVIRDGLNAAVERHLAHLFDVYFQGTDDGRLQRFMTGLDRTFDSYHAIAKELENFINA